MRKEKIVMSLKTLVKSIIIVPVFAISLAFCQVQTGTVKDVDGNVYKTIKIGSQEWMVENLKVTHYRNGDPIPNITDNKEWINLSTGAYCNFNNDVGNVAIYGRLYKGYAINDIRGIAPEGWHVPTDVEWQTLMNYLGGNYLVAGGKLKGTGTAYWTSPNTGATNETGFAALPGGYRGPNGNFYTLGDLAFFWSSTEYGTKGAWGWNLSYYHTKVFRSGFDRRYGFSVRCLRDNVRSETR